MADACATRANARSTDTSDAPSPIGKSRSDLARWSVKWSASSVEGESGEVEGESDVTGSVEPLPDSGSIDSEDESGGEGESNWGGRRNAGMSQSQHRNTCKAKTLQILVSSPSSAV